MVRSFYYILFSFLSLTSVNLSFGQVTVVDSLKNVIESEIDIDKKVALLNRLCEEYQSNDYKKSLKYAKEALSLSQQINKKDSARKPLISQSANNVGAGYLLLDNYEKALKFLLLSLKTAEEIKDTTRMSNALYNLSIVYDYKGEKEKSAIYIEKSIRLDELSGNLESAAYGYSVLAADYFFQPDYNKGMVYYEKAMTIANKLDDIILKGILYENRAVGLKYSSRYLEALKYHKMAIEIDLKTNKTASLETNYLNMADLYFVMNNYQKSIEYNLKSLNIALELKSTNNIMKAYSGLAESYEQIGDKGNAYKSIQLYANWKDTLYKQQNASAMAEMQTKYETEKKEAENTLLLAENQLDKAELDKKSIQQKMLLALLGLVLLIVGYVVYSLNQKKKTNKLLNTQNEEILHKNEIIEEKNKDITDSINYAQRIQEAILPEEALLNSIYESFIYYRPKDIVSGDFYWIKEIDNKIYFAVVDCTGHGVPGAFMSIIGANSLSKIIEDLKIEKPGEILDELNILVNRALGVENNSDSFKMRDGMDISICTIDKKNKRLEYAGANNALYLLRKSSTPINELPPIMDNGEIFFHEIKANKMAIGGGENKKVYTTHSILLEKEDTLYLFSDGYADQFGGPQGKKFMYKPFKRMFLSIQDKSMELQLAHIDKTMREWKKDIEQLDDICVMGVRI